MQIGLHFYELKFAFHHQKQYFCSRNRARVRALLFYVPTADILQHYYITKKLKLLTIMKQKLLNSLRLRACLLVAVLCGAFSNAWGQSDYSSDYTGNVSLSISGSSNAGACKVIINNTQYDGIKAGTSSKAGAVQIAVPSGTKYLHLHVAGWNNESVTLTVTPTGYSENITLTANSGIAGNSPFTFSGDPSTNDYYKVISFSSPLTSNTNLTFTASSGKRFVVWGVTAEEEVSAQTCAKPSFNPIEGTYTQAQNVIISTETQGATIYYTTDGTDPTNASTQYNGAINISSTTTIKAIAMKNGMDNSSIAEATYTILSLQTISEARTQGSGSVYTQGVVTSCSGTTAYIQDDNAAICVYGQALTVGDRITVRGTLTNYNGLLEITSPTVTVINSGNTVEPEVMTVAEAVASTNQGWLIKIENATVTAINNQNTTIEQDGSSIVVRGISNDVEYAVNDQLTLTGNIGYYNGNQIANPTDVTVVESTTPAIQADNIQLAYNATSGTIAYTIDNPVAGTVLNATTTAGWISNIEVGSEAVTFTTTANDGNEDRTATITLSYIGAEDKVVTITQKHYVADYASLPFEFDGGKADVENTPGLSEEGLDSDYGSSPKLKFNTTNDYLILKFNERPGTLTFDIKGNTFSDGTFKVQVSEDGATYTDLGTYTELGTTQHESFDNLGENVRYIKWIYTEKVNGNVALGNISLTAYGETPTYTVSWTAGENIDLFVFAGDESETIENGSSVDEGTTVMVSVDVADGYELEALIVEDAEENAISLEEIEAGVYYSFEMPASNVTITATAVASSVTPVTGDKYVKVTSTDDLTDGQYLIVYEEGGLAFNGSLTTLDATGNTIAVTINNNEIAATNETRAAEFTIDATEGTIKSASGYYIGRTGDSNGMNSSDTEAYTNTISFTDGNADIVSSGGAYLRYNATSGQDRFRYFKSSSYTNQKAVQLYKFVEGVEPITVTISDALYTTYVTPADIDFTGDVTAYVVDRIDANSMHMTQIDKVPEGTPVILKAEEAGTYTLSIADKTDDVVNLLQASYGDIEGGENIYALAKKNGVVGFYQVSSDVKIPAGKAYLDINKTNASEGNVKAFLAFDFSAGEDAIKGVESVSKDAVIFNVAGQRVNHASHGLYIINGKKVIIK